MADEQMGPHGDAPGDAPDANADHTGRPAGYRNGTGTDDKWRKRPFLIGLGVLVALVLIVEGARYWHYATTHVSTDDAYVAGNLVSVSPVISGTLAALNVDEGYTVSQGQLLARIDDSGPRAAVRQAEATYRAALSRVPQAERNLVYQQESTDAAIRKANAALQAQQARITGAARQLALTSGTTASQVRQARAEETQAAALERQAEAQVQVAEAALADRQQAVETALASLEDSRQQVTTSQQALDAANARIAAAQAELDRASKDEARYRVLYDEDAVAAQVYDNARAQAKTARADLNAATAQAAEAASEVQQARVGGKQAASQVAQARQAASQAAAQLRAAQRAADAAHAQVKVAQAGVTMALANSAQVGVQQANVATTASQRGESGADVRTAQAGHQQVAARRLAVQTARAEAAQAGAALANARVTLADTYIYAPSDGTVVHKDANVGDALAPGSPIVTMTVGDYVWVTANFKETKLTNVRSGQPAEIDVDAFPGKVFKGVVRSIDEASGATTALLPPENATGNFTKVVQRIPVRIEFVPAAAHDDPKYARLADIRRLRQGMSVTATVQTDVNPRHMPPLRVTRSAVRSEYGPTGTPGLSGQSVSPTPIPLPGATDGAALPAEEDERGPARIPGRRGTGR